MNQEAATPNTEETAKSMETIETAAGLDAELAKYGAMEPPAPPAWIRVTNDELAMEGLPTIPEDYRKFLLQSNGAQNGGFMLLGTEPMEMAGGHLADPIYEATVQLAELGIPGSEKWLVLGRCTAGTKLIFDSGQQKYGVADPSGGDILFSYDSIAEFAVDWLKRSRLSGRTD